MPSAGLSHDFPENQVRGAAATVAALKPKPAVLECLADCWRFPNQSWGSLPKKRTKLQKLTLFYDSEQGVSVTILAFV